MIWQLDCGRFPGVYKRKRGHLFSREKICGPRCFFEQLRKYYGYRWRRGCKSRCFGCTSPVPTISNFCRARRRRVEPANNLVGSLAKDDVFAGRACLQFLDPSLCGLQVSNDFNPFEIRAVYLLEDIEGGVHGDTSLQMSQNRRNGIMQGPMPSEIF